MTAPLLGIDSGTTFSLVSVMSSGAPILLRNAEGETLTASAVSITDEGTLLIGGAARARATLHPSMSALEFKRDMGTDALYTLGARRFTPVELSSLVLGALKRDAEAELGVGVEEVVVTVPAYFGEVQRQATRDAASIAGLNAVRLLNEPTAAALAYGLNQRERDVRAIVLDLGGGTFDVTVLEITAGVVEIRSTAGDARLGGTDFDSALANLLLDRMCDELGLDIEGDDRATARVYEAAEQAKKRLSSKEETRVALPELGRKKIDVGLTVTRDEAEAAWKPLLDRIRAPIHRALADARLGADAIEEVLFVGGSSRLPCAQRLAAKTFGRLPLRALPPDEAVALGAAVQAALIRDEAAVSDLVVTDIAPFTLGISSSSRSGHSIISGGFAPILERGTVLPASRSRSFSTLVDDQSELDVEVYQGEHALCRDNVKIGQYRLKNLPRGPAGGFQIEIRFTYDMSGLLEIDATLPSGKVQSHFIERTSGALSKEQIEAARAAMGRLKIDPRQTLPNTTALARADALHVELTGGARQMLQAQMTQFRMAMATQDPKLIEEERERLTTVVSMLRARYQG